MWIITIDGFYSAVNKPADPPGFVTVRSRVRADLERLLSYCSPEEHSEIEKHAGTDYPYRVLISRAALGRYLTNEISGLKYGNFKDAVGRVRGLAREIVYARVWAALVGLENLKD